MRGDIDLAEFGDEVACVKALVGAEGDRLGARPAGRRAALLARGVVRGALAAGRRSCRSIVSASALIPQCGSITSARSGTEGPLGFDTYHYDKNAPATLGPRSLRAQLTVEACCLLQQLPLEIAVLWIEQGRKLAEPQAQGGTPGAAAKKT